MRSNFKLRLIHFTSFSVIIFVAYLINFKNLSPTSINWLLYDETAQSYIGWAFFKQSDFFQWPIYQNNLDGLSINSSIAYTASNPLISIILKYIFSPFREIDYQFHSIWILIIFIFQYLIFRKILILFNISGLALEISSLLIILQPFWLFRLRLGHIDGMAHFLILAAIYYYLNNSKSVYWFTTILLSAAIHPYLNIMLFLIYLFWLFESRKEDKVTKIKWLFVTVLSNFLILKLSGFLQLNSKNASMSGYGLFKTNLNALLDSGVDLNDGIIHKYSYIIPDLAQNIGDYEGYSFLGVGILVTAIVVTINFRQLKSVKNIDELKRLKYLWLFTLVLFIMSLSNNIDLGKTRIFTFSNLLFVDMFFNFFRVSARFSWPFLYISVILVIIYFNKIQRKKYVLNLWISLIVITQFIDVVPLVSEIRHTYQVRSNWKSKLNLPLWDEIIQKNQIKKIVMVNPVNNPELNIDISKLALDNDIKVNFGYFARVNQGEIQAQNDRYRSYLQREFLDKDTIYLLKGQSEIHDYISKSSSKCRSFFRQNDYLVVYYSECA